MVRIELITVGHELLIGSTVNTNASWIGRRLSSMGLLLNQVNTVDDDSKEICRALRESMKRGSDFIIFVGGLGPTHDDITVESVSRCIGKELVLSKEAVQMIIEHYKKTGINVEMNETRLKMARIPEGSVPLKNEKGTAPGVRLEYGGSVIFFLPGVPREMKALFNSYVLKEITRNAGRFYSARKVLKVRKVFESSIAPILKKIQKENPNSYIKSHPKGVREGISMLEVEIVTRSTSKRDAVMKAESIAEEIRKKIEE